MIDPPPPHPTQQLPPEKAPPLDGLVDPLGRISRSDKPILYHALRSMSQEQRDALACGGGSVCSRSVLDALWLMVRGGRYSDALGLYNAAGRPACITAADLGLDASFFGPRARGALENGSGSGIGSGGEENLALFLKLAAKESANRTSSSRAKRHGSRHHHGYRRGAYLPMAEVVADPAGGVERLCDRRVVAQRTLNGLLYHGHFAAAEAFAKCWMELKRTSLNVNEVLTWRVRRRIPGNVNVRIRNTLTG